MKLWPTCTVLVDRISNYFINLPITTQLTLFVSQTAFR